MISRFCRIHTNHGERARKAERQTLSDTYYQKHVVISRITSLWMGVGSLKWYKDSLLYIVLMFSGCIACFFMICLEQYQMLNRIRSMLLSLYWNKANHTLNHAWIERVSSGNKYFLKQGNYRKSKSNQWNIGHMIVIVWVTAWDENEMYRLNLMRQWFRYECLFDRNNKTSYYGMK